MEKENLREMIFDNMRQALEPITSEENAQLHRAFRSSSNLTEAVTMLKKVTLPNFPADIRKKIEAANPIDITGIFFEAAIRLKRCL